MSSIRFFFPRNLLFMDRLCCTFVRRDWQSAWHQQHVMHIIYQNWWEKECAPFRPPYMCASAVVVVGRPGPSSLGPARGNIDWVRWEAFNTQHHPAGAQMRNPSTPLLFVANFTSALLSLSLCLPSWDQSRRKTFIKLLCWIESAHYWAGIISSSLRLFIYLEGSAGWLVGSSRAAADLKPPICCCPFPSPLPWVVGKHVESNQPRGKGGPLEPVPRDLKSLTLRTFITIIIRADGL